MEDMDGRGKVPIDRVAWSPSSRRSLGHYDENATEYEGIRCRCYGCGLSFVCSAEEQRNACEVQKSHVSWLPKLCPVCTAKLADLRARDGVMQARWNSDKEIQALRAKINIDVKSMQVLTGKFSTQNADALKRVKFDRKAIGAKGLPYEKLDQLTMEILMGVR